MAFRGEARPREEVALFQSQEVRGVHERFHVPIDEATPEVVRQPTAHLHGGDYRETRFGSFAPDESGVSASTRWTRGRGNKSFAARAGGAAAMVLISPIVAVGRTVIFCARDAAVGVMAGAAWATGILRNQNPLVQVLGAVTILPAALVGGLVGGAVYGAVQGFFGAWVDIGKAVVSQATGGNVNYFSLAYRKYRD